MIARRQFSVRTILPLVGLVLFGCSNDPDALTLKVEPTQPVFRSGELIRLNVTLQTSDRTVCLSKHRYFRVHIAKQDNVPTGADDQKFFRCGTGIVETLILFPWLFAFAWLDVADVSGRFDVLGPGSKSCQLIAVSAQGKWQTGQVESDTQYVNRSGEPIGSGKIAITIVLHNERGGCGDFLPLPIGWSLFCHPVEAKTSVILEGP